MKALTAAVSMAASASLIACGNPQPDAPVRPTEPTTNTPDGLLDISPPDVNQPGEDVTSTTEPTTTVTSAPPQRPVTTLEVVPVPTTAQAVLPEYSGPESDDEWWQNQPGYNGSYPSGSCGGDLPPCWVMQRESGGNPAAISPYGFCDTGDTRCYGKWQASIGTWGGYGGYANAALAPESVQDEWARSLWNNGRGCSHWNAC